MFRVLPEIYWHITENPPILKWCVIARRSAEIHTHPDTFTLRRNTAYWIWFIHCYKRGWLVMARMQLSNNKLPIVVANRLYNIIVHLIDVAVMWINFARQPNYVVMHANTEAVANKTSVWKIYRKRSTKLFSNIPVVNGIYWCVYHKFNTLCLI